MLSVKINNEDEAYIFSFRSCSSKSYSEIRVLLTIQPSLTCDTKYCISPSIWHWSVFLCYHGDNSLRSNVQLRRQPV